jgi:hypothetical protein
MRHIWHSAVRNKIGEVGETQGISYLHGFLRLRAAGRRRGPKFAAQAGGVPIRYPMHS